MNVDSTPILHNPSEYQDEDKEDGDDQKKDGQRTATP